MASSESGRRKSWRCWSSLASMPVKVSTLLLAVTDWNGSGCTRKRYQLSSCASMPHPVSPTPVTSPWKSPTRAFVLAGDGVPGVGLAPAFAGVDGNHPRKPSGASATLERFTSSP